MLNIDWGFITFVVLASGAAGGFLFCFRHMMHEGKPFDEDHHKKETRENNRQDIGKIVRNG